jgi:tetratricopeptide (TPR) repeat protein
LQAALLLGQNRIGDSLAFLEAEIEQGSADVSAVSQVVQIHLQSGNLETARSYLDQALLDNPTDSTLQMMNASLFAIAGEFDASEAVFRDLIAAFPKAEAPVLRLYNLLISTDQGAKADVVIDAALEAQPASMNLRWIRAGQLEGQGDIDGAIAVYEDMYAADSSAVAIANNLAPLIATHKDDPESMARAATIAKRLRELDVPAFQDTYGWIAYRQGNLNEARAYLEPAAAGLPDDPLVQYHLGMTYAGLGEIEKATAQLTRAVALADQSSLPQFEIARAKLRDLGQ